MSPEEPGQTEDTEEAEERAAETYSPWTVVDLVFAHLSERGLHPTLGQGGSPGTPAAELLRALGITPTPQGDARVPKHVREELARLREAMLDDS